MLIKCQNPSLWYLLSGKELILINFFIPFSICSHFCLNLIFLSLICILPRSNCHCLWLHLWPIFHSFSHLSTSVISHRKHNTNCFQQKSTLNSAPITTFFPCNYTLHTFPHGIPQNQPGKGARLNIQIWKLRDLPKYHFSV